MKNESINRLGIFIFYDRQNIVDDYVLYLLKDLKKNLKHLIIISNSDLNKENCEKLQSIGDELLIRRNEGLDAGALYEYFNHYKEYLDYDEVVCLNDTFYGPFYSFEIVFEEMSKRKIDFWGLTEGHPQPDSRSIFEKGLPAHIQTFFIVFRKKVTNSKAFQDYWKNYDYANMLTFDDVVTKHELIFTEYLVKNGFAYDVYIKDQNVSHNQNQNYNNYAYNTSSQTIACKAPFIKRKSLVQSLKDTLYLTDKNDIQASLTYIKENTNYDLSLIWQNLLRLYNLKDIKEGINLYRIIEEKEKKESLQFIIYIDDEFSLNLLNNYLKNPHYPTHLFTSNKKIYNLLQETYEIKLIKSNAWQKELQILISQIDSKYVGYCYLMALEDKITLISESVSENILSNLSKNKNYLNGIINEFHEDKNIGIAMVPNNYHFDYFFTNLIWRVEAFEKVKEYVKNYDNVSICKTPISYTNGWIVETKLLQSLDIDKWICKDNNDFSNLLTIVLPYYVASKGKYPILVLSKENAINHLNFFEDIYEKTYAKIWSKNPGKYTYIETLIMLDQIEFQNKKITRRIKNKIRRMIREKRIK